jgi:hypothetical protein
MSLGLTSGPETIYNDIKFCEQVDPPSAADRKLALDVPPLSLVMDRPD